MKKILIVLLIIFFAVSLVPRTFQNDTFYTVTIGRDILQYGFDGIEHYSWHSGLKYTSPHWLFDVINYLIFNKFSWTGLYIFVCALVSLEMLIFYFSLRKKKINEITALVGTLVTCYLLKGSFTDRAQIVSYILFFLEINLIESFLKDKNKKSVFRIFIISVIIANAHAATWPLLIILVFPYIAEYLFSLYTLKNVTASTLKRDKKKLEKLKLKNADKEKIESLEKSIKDDEEFLKTYEPRKNTKIIIEKNDNAKYLILIIAVILLGGLFTPTGTMPYTYFIKAMRSNVTNFINEHMPLIPATSLEFVIMVIFTVACIGFIDSKMKLSDAFLLLGLYFMAIISKRHMFLLFLLGCPILIKMISDFIEKNIKESENKKQVDKILLIFITVLVIIIGSQEFIENYKQEYIDETAYPVEASSWFINYLDENNISKNDLKLYNQYNYGSYLIFRGIPVFIDSRAEQPYCSTFNKGVSVFKDYMDVFQGRVSYIDLFKKYDINYAFVQKKSIEYIYMSEDENCEKIYEDEYFAIYKYLPNF